jgi:hypothetical protein
VRAAAEIRIDGGTEGFGVTIEQSQQARQPVDARGRARWALTALGMLHGAKALEHPLGLG